MANSKLPHVLHRDPFQRPTLSPGPLGHNDYASPDSPPNLRGDTPGPLGIKDHADPDARTAFTQIRKPPINLRISDLGVRFIWKEEFVQGISERLHWPRGSSGVTLGAGYDMKERTKVEVAADLRTVGLRAEESEQAASGAGLIGQDANRFVKKNRETVVLNEAQALKLLRLILPGYEALVKRILTVPLLQHQYDALVSFAYNPGGRLARVIRNINSGNEKEAMWQIAAANTSGGEILQGLTTRRKHEIDLYKFRRYEA